MAQLKALRIICVLFIAILGNLVITSLAFGQEASKALTEALAQVKLFSGLTEAERGALVSAVTLRNGSEGERIIEQEKPLDKMVIILDGEAEVWVNGELIATLSGQPLVGEVEFLDKLPASADVVLLKETKLIEIDNAELVKIMDNQPRIGYVIMSEIAKIEGQRLRDTDQ